MSANRKALVKEIADLGERLSVEGPRLIQARKDAEAGLALAEKALASAAAELRQVPREIEREITDREEQLRVSADPVLEEAREALSNAVDRLRVSGAAGFRFTAASVRAAVETLRAAGAEIEALKLDPRAAGTAEVRAILDRCLQHLRENDVDVPAAFRLFVERLRASRDPLPLTLEAPDVSAPLN